MTTAAEAQPGSGTQAAGRVADVLLAVAAAGEPVGVSELARRLALSKAVVHRMLRSLADRELVAAGGPRGTYRLGPAAALLGARALASLDVRSAAMPVLRDLQAESGETATISEIVGNGRAYVDQVIGTGEIRMTVELGKVFPLHAGSSGKAILAFARGDLLTWVLDHELAALTDRTIVDRDVLEGELARVRRDGAAFSRGERERGAASVAAPVLGLDETAVGAISVCGPIERFDLRRLDALAPRVRAAAERISERLAGD